MIVAVLAGALILGFVAWGSYRAGEKKGREPWCTPTACLGASSYLRLLGRTTPYPQCQDLHLPQDSTADLPCLVGNQVTTTRQAGS
jgi:hypothetical protein